MTLQLKARKHYLVLLGSWPSFISKLTEYQTFKETLASLIELKPANKSIKCSRYPRAPQDEARVCSKAFNTDVDSHDY